MKQGCASLPLGHLRRTIRHPIRRCDGSHVARNVYKGAKSTTTVEAEAMIQHCTRRLGRQHYSSISGASSETRVNGRAFASCTEEIIRDCLSTLAALGPSLLPPNHVWTTVRIFVCCEKERDRSALLCLLSVGWSRRRYALCCFWRQYMMLHDRIEAHCRKKWRVVHKFLLLRIVVAPIAHIVKGCVTCSNGAAGVGRHLMDTI